MKFVCPSRPLCGTTVVFSLLMICLGAPALSAPLINGLAPHTELGQEKFLAALFVDSPSTAPSTLLSANEHKRMELRVTAKRVSARRLNSLWIEGMAINVPGSVLTKHADNMVKFTSMIKGRLVAGDTLSIETAPGEGTRVTLNGVELGQIYADGFFELLLRTWIGSVPLSSDFRAQILKAGDVDSALMARFNAITPQDHRIASVRSWLKKPARSLPAPANTEQNLTRQASKPLVNAPSLALATAPALSPTGSEDKVLFSGTAPDPNESLAAEDALASGEDEPLDFTSTGSQPATSGNTLAAAGMIKAPELSTEENSPAAEAPETETPESENDEDNAAPLTAENLLSRQLYHSKLLKWTYNYLSYPRRALKRGQEGSVRLAVVIDREGQLKTVTPIEESRYKLLNSEAIGAVERAEPFPPVPEGVNGEEFRFSLPIVFKLPN